jgi:ABC-type nickel/cobalt efflux system permease component RcnA
VSITWADAFKIAVAVVVVQALVGAVVGGAAFTVSNPAFAFLPFVFLAAVGAYLAYRSYRGTTPHTHGER